MPLEVAEVDVLQEYLKGVLGRADHHARGVDLISLALAGAVVWRKVGTLEVMEREGETKNVLWFRTEKSRYALSYNHKAGTIELREKTTQGRVLASLTNDTTLSELRMLFEGL